MYSSQRPITLPGFILLLVFALLPLWPMPALAKTTATAAKIAVTPRYFPGVTDMRYKPTPAPGFFQRNQGNPFQVRVYTGPRPPDNGNWGGVGGAGMSGRNFRGGGGGRLTK